MVRLNEVQAQLISLDNHFRFIGISELKQLACALQPGEQIMDCLKGWHDGTIAVMCATDKRLIIVDKNTTKDCCEEIDYVGISEIRHHDRGWSSSIHVYVPGKVYEFISWHIKRLKNLHSFMGRHLAYVKNQAEGAQEFVNKLQFQSTVRPATTSRNWAVFAKRIGAASVK